MQSIYTIQIAGICHTQHVPIRTYSSKNACLIGETAHGTSSFNDSSSSLAMEEALVLVALLSRTTSRSSVPAALRAYDEICRPRAEIVSRAAADVTLLATGQAPGVGLDPNLLARNLEQKLNIIESLDITAHCLAALTAMDHHCQLARGW